MNSLLVWRLMPNIKMQKTGAEEGTNSNAHARF
jgi:hypothetical protein